MKNSVGYLLYKFSGYTIVENPQQQAGKNKKNGHYHLCP